jgi:hypothetical protein
MYAAEPFQRTLSFLRRLCEEVEFTDLKRCIEFRYILLCRNIGQLSAHPDPAEEHIFLHCHQDPLDPFRCPFMLLAQHQQLNLRVWIPHRLRKITLKKLNRSQ